MDDNITVLEEPVKIQNISALEQKSIRRQDKFKRYTKIKKIVKKSGTVYDISRVIIGITLTLI